MAKTITTSVGGLSDAGVRSAIGELQSAVVDQILNSGALAIGTSATTAVKIVTKIYAFVTGVLLSKAAATEVALSGTVVNATFNVFVLSIDNAATVTATMGTAGATIGAVVFPAIPADQAVIGFVIINPTGTGNFVGGTTALSDGTVVPNAVYINTVGTFNPNVLAL